jgi:hypothetical protein
MLNAKTTAGLIVAAALLLCGAARADIYKCTDDDGNLMFSQTPCAKEEPVQIKPATVSTSATDCTYAGKFADAAARLMRRGMRSDEVFDNYGGLGSLSKGSVGVINYVYSFQTNSAVSLERIAGLAQAKCEAKSFGDASCEVLPVSFTDSLGGCDAGDAETSTPKTAQVTGQAEPQVFVEAPSASTAGFSQSNQRAVAAHEEQLTEQCKKKYRDEIDAIDAQMRSGYSSAEGERYRQQLRGLTEKLRAC